jgi:hypothetical protein
MIEEPVPGTPSSETVPAATGTAVPAGASAGTRAGPAASAAGDGYAGAAAWKWRAALALVALVTAASYAWAISADPLEGYYAAAVRSMSMSWHDFIYGAFDPAGTITLDKLPGDGWPARPRA